MAEEWEVKKRIYFDAGGQKDRNVIHDASRLSTTGNYLIHLKLIGMTGSLLSSEIVVERFKVRIITADDNIYSKE